MEGKKKCEKRNVGKVKVEEGEDVVEWATVFFCLLDFDGPTGMFVQSIDATGAGNFRRSDHNTSLVV